MEITDYCSYELSKALKAAGFDEPCDKWIASKSFSYYDEDECSDHNAVIEEGWLISQKQKEKYDQHALPYLTLWQAQKWLREKKGIDIEPRIWFIGNRREYRPYIMPPRCKDFIAHPPQKSYEAALSAGIAAALELIKRDQSGSSQFNKPYCDI